MNKLLIKQMILPSLILGGICGCLVLVPFINIFVFLFLMSFAAPAVYLFLKRKDKIGIFEPKEAASLGAVSGFISFMGFSALMVPLSLVISLINSFTFHIPTWFSIIKTTLSMGIISGVFILIMLLLFTGMLSAIFNAFTSMVIVFIIQSTEDITKKKDDVKIDVEIK